MEGDVCGLSEHLNEVREQLHARRFEFGIAAQLVDRAATEAEEPTVGDTLKRR